MTTETAIRFERPAISRAEDLVFGQAPSPLELSSGMRLGGGTVYPELNFTLPALTISDGTMPRIEQHYRQIVTEALRRAAELQVPGVQLEFETLPPMTEMPGRAIALCRILLEGMAEAKERYGLASSLRFTPNDNRELIRPPPMRSGAQWEAMLETFEGCCALGVDLLSIESVGGKEVHDPALTTCDIGQVIFSLCVMGVRDMRFLWTRMAEICTRHGTVPAGDSACGFGNTAMVLAEQRLIPRVFAAVVRPITAVRSLVAYECGARGPGKDCAYENPILKAITGYPMAMEGKSASCAHLSPVGNVAAATADLWSNESVQNIKLLGAMAPTCSLESLAYDCRLFNRASADGPEGARRLRDWLVEPDVLLDPQALVITPQAAVRFAETICDSPGPYEAGKRVGLQAVAMIREALVDGRTHIDAREQPYLDLIEAGIEDLPEAEDAFIAGMMDEVDRQTFVTADYDLA